MSNWTCDFISGPSKLESTIAFGVVIISIGNRISYGTHITLAFLQLFVHSSFPCMFIGQNYKIITAFQSSVFVILEEISPLLADNTPQLFV